MEPPKYHVVKFLSEAQDTYAFVPESWVEARRSTDNTIVIVYPPEDVVATEERIKKNEKPAADWKEYLCELLFTTNDYGEAKIDVMLKNHEAKKEVLPPKNEEPKREKRKYTKRTSDITPKTKIPKWDYEMNKTNIQGNILTPPLENEPTVTFNIPVGDLLCQVQVTTKMLTQRHEVEMYEAPPMKMNVEPKILFTPYKFQKTPNMSQVKNSKANVSADDEDTRWTLIHQEPRPGLVELVKNSHVYVNQNQLRRHTSVATSSRGLIRTLLTVIFTYEALSKCTLTFKKDKLDCNAVNALLNYVQYIAAEKKWGAIDRDYFNDCIRKKLQEIKRRSRTQSDNDHSEYLC